MDAKASHDNEKLILVGAAVCIIAVALLAVPAFRMLDRRIDAENKKEQARHIAYITTLLNSSGAIGDYTYTEHHLFIDRDNSLSGIKELCTLSYATKLRFTWVPGRMEPFIVRYKVVESGGPHYSNDCPIDGVFSDNGMDFLTDLKSVNEVAAQKSALLAEAPRR
jgi:hypothetical protein